MKRPAVEHRMATVCPFCGAEHELASPIEAGYAEPPRVGDVTLCIRCGEASVFEAGGGLRRPTPEEVEALADDLGMQRARLAWRRARRRR